MAGVLRTAALAARHGEGWEGWEGVHWLVFRRVRLREPGAQIQFPQPIGMAVLVEVHGKSERQKTLKLKPDQSG